MDALVEHAVAVPGGELRIAQPRESAELPDDGAVEWAPLVPYWSVLWRSGVALARALTPADLHGMRVVELGCGLGLPSLVAARAKARVLATDSDREALDLLRDNAVRNRVSLATARVDWARPQALRARGRFDVALAADVLYERQAVAQLLDLLPALAPEIWIADPARPPAGAFLEQARRRWRVHTTTDGVVAIHRLSSRRARGAARAG